MFLEECKYSVKEKKKKKKYIKDDLWNFSCDDNSNSEKSNKETYDEVKIAQLNWHACKKEQI